jgi:hypothetical protein
LKKALDRNLENLENEIILTDLMKMLVLLTNFSSPRQEQISLHNAIPLLIEISLLEIPKREI